MYLVIGAGPAGHCECLCAGTSGTGGYKVIDRSNIIASTWHSLYPSLRLNTSRWFSQMPGKRFPLRNGVFPSGQEYYQYLSEFVREHDFNIHLGIEVYRVARKTVSGASKPVKAWSIIRL